MDQIIVVENYNSESLWENEKLQVKNTLKDLLKKDKIEIINLIINHMDQTKSIRYVGDFRILISTHIYLIDSIGVVVYITNTEKFASVSEKTLSLINEQKNEMKRIELKRLEEKEKSKQL